MERSIWQAMRGEGVRVVGVNTGGFMKNDGTFAGSFAAMLGVTFPLVEDIERHFSQVAGPGDGVNFPLDIVLDRQGRILLISSAFDVQSIVAALREGLLR